MSRSRRPGSVWRYIDSADHVIIDLTYLIDTDDFERFTHFLAADTAAARAESLAAKGHNSHAGHRDAVGRWGRQIPGRKKRRLAA